MLFTLLFLGASFVGFVWHTRRHYDRLLPPCRIDERHGRLQVRRYPKLAVAEVRVTGTASQAMRAGTQLLDKYFRDERIARFALPLLAEKVDAADQTWVMAALLPMALDAAPSPRNRAVQLKEVPPHRAFSRLFHGAVVPDEMLARQKADMLPLVNDTCRSLGCNKLSTVITMHRYPWWVPALLRVSDLLVRVTDDTAHGRAA